MVVLSTFGSTRGTDRHCGGTTEYWVVLEGLGSNRGHWGILWSTVRYCWKLLGTTGYWVVLGGHWLVLRVLEGSGGTVWYQRVLWRTIGYWGYWVVQGGT